MVAEAGGTVAGGHTIRSEEPIFGLAVQGVVHPDRVLTKRGAKPGDVLVLSKPIGTGIVLAGARRCRQAVGHRRHAPAEPVGRRAARRRWATPTHAVTDVTGYGLAGHGWEMAERSGVRLVVDIAVGAAVPGRARAPQRPAPAPAVTLAIGTTSPAG